MPATTAELYHSHAWGVCALQKEVMREPYDRGPMPQPCMGCVSTAEWGAMCACRQSERVRREAQDLQSRTAEEDQAFNKLSAQLKELEASYRQAGQRPLLSPSVTYVV